MLAVLAAMAMSLSQMKDHRRVLVVAAPSAKDLRLAAQRNALAGWHGADERDVSVVEVVGDQVAGASDSAAALRHAHHLAADRFTVLLIGKDGHEAYRSDEPVLAEELQGRIDAMPMRRAGLR